MASSKILIIVSVLFLTACQSQGTKPQIDESTAELGSEQSINPPASQASPTKRPAPKMAAKQSDLEPISQLDMLANRMTAVQDHLLQLKSQNGQLQRQNQELALKLQVLTNDLQSFAASASNTTPSEPASPDAFNGVLDQITMMANELGSQVQDGAYQIASTYTAKGQWVLIRFHRYTGEAWLADKGQWNLLEESGATGTAEYEVTVLRADNDVKGYVVARINKISGETWWLKQDTWQPYVTQ